MARREIDTDAILEEATKDDIYNAWLLVCTALIEQEMISFDEIAEMTDSVNRYIKNPPSSEASKEEKTRHAEQLMGICCPYDHINPGNIKSAVELEKFKKKVWKVAIHTSLCVLCLGLEATGKYSPQDLRKIFFWRGYYFCGDRTRPHIFFRIRKAACRPGSSLRTGK